MIKHCADITRVCRVCYCTRYQLFPFSADDYDFFLLTPNETGTQIPHLCIKCTEKRKTVTKQTGFWYEKNNY